MGSFNLRETPSRNANSLEFLADWSGFDGKPNQRSRRGAARSECQRIQRRVRYTRTTWLADTETILGSRSGSTACPKVERGNKGQLRSPGRLRSPVRTRPWMACVLRVTTRQQRRIQPLSTYGPRLHRKGFCLLPRPCGSRPRKTKERENAAPGA